MAVFDPALYNSQAPGTAFPGLTWTARRPRRADAPGVDVQSRVLGAARRLRLRPVRATARRCCAAATACSTSTTRRGRTRGFIDLPYGVTFTNVGATSPLSQVPNVDPNTQPGHQRRDSGDRRQAAADPELELHVAARLPYRMTVEAGYVGSKSDRLLNDGINNLNIVPFGAMLNDPNGDPNQLSAATASTADLPVSQHTHYQNYNALQTLLSRGELEVQLHGRRTRGRRRSASAAAARGRRRSRRATSAIRAYGVLGYDRTHVLNVGYSYLLPTLDGAAGAQEGDPRRLAAHRRVDLHQRRAAPAAARATGVNFGLAGTIADGDADRQQRVITGSPDDRGDAGADLRSARGRQRRSGAQPELLRAADAGPERQLHLPGPARTGLHQPRLRGVQELPDGRDAEVPVPRLVHQRVQPPAAVPRRQHEPEAAVHERPAVATGTSASCRRTTSTAGASSSSPSRCISESRRLRQSSRSTTPEWSPRRP